MMKGGIVVREEEAMALLVMSRGIGYAHREAALRQAGSASALCAEPERYRETLGNAGVSALRESVKNAQALLERVQEQELTLLLRGAPGYPVRLEKTARAPHLLFVKGKAALDDPFPLAVVGTRRATRYGLEHTRFIARDLARAGMCIVSGLALGIDAAGHTGALDGGGRTIAVLGGAHDRFYPADNRPLLGEILESGGSVISEYPPGTKPANYSFLERNRIIAGLSLGVLVTEAPLRSGALRTVREGLEEGREIFALPGSVDSENSRLPNRLIAEGATLVTCAQDVLDALVIEPERETAQREKKTREGTRKTPPAREGGKASAPAEKAVPDGLEGDERAVYTALLEGESSFDDLCERTGIAPDDLGALLMMMEMDGYVRALPGLMYAAAGRE